jgi:hypothetical protein
VGIKTGQLLFLGRKKGALFLKKSTQSAFFKKGHHKRALPKNFWER